MKQLERKNGGGCLIFYEMINYHSFINIFRTMLTIMFVNHIFSQLELVYKKKESLKKYWKLQVLYLIVSVASVLLMYRTAIISEDSTISEYLSYDRLNMLMLVLVVCCAVTIIQIMLRKKFPDIYGEFGSIKNSKSI